MPILSPDEIEKQLTARRLGEEELTRKLNKLSSQITKLQKSIDTLNVNTTTTVSAGEIDAALVGGNVIHNLSHIFRKVVTFISDIVTTIIAPSTDGTSAIKITKADKTTEVFAVNTSNGRIRVTQQGAGYASLDLVNDVPETAQLVLYSNANGRSLVLFQPNSQAIEFWTNSTKRMTIGGAGTMGFFGAAAASKQTLNSYTTNSQSSSYTSTPAALAQAATLSDLNTLRVAYENIRASYDDLRTKMQTTTLVG